MCMVGWAGNGSRTCRVSRCDRVNVALAARAVYDHRQARYLEVEISGLNNSLVQCKSAICEQCISIGICLLSLRFG